jgi:hypothetical protein
VPNRIISQGQLLLVVTNGDFHTMRLELWSRPEAGTEMELKIPAATAKRSDLRRFVFLLMIGLARFGSRQISGPGQPSVAGITA